MHRPVDDEAKHGVRQHNVIARFVHYAHINMADKAVVLLVLLKFGLYAHLVNYQ